MSRELPGILPPVPSEPSRWKPWVFAIAFVLTLAAAVYGLSRIQPASRISADAPPPARPAALFDSRSVIDRFLAASSPAECEELVLNPEATLPRMHAYLSRPGVTWPQLRRVVDQATTIQYLPARVDRWMLADASGKEYPALVVESGEGARLNWEHLVAYGEIAWEEVMLGQPSEAKKLRVILRKPTYRNDQPQGAGVAEWFDVSHPHSDQVLTARLDDPLFPIALRAAGVAENAPIPCRISLAFEGQSHLKTPVIREARPLSWQDVNL